MQCVRQVLRHLKSLRSHPLLQRSCTPCWDSKEVIVQFAVAEGSTLNGNRYRKMFADHLHPDLKVKRWGRITGVLYHQDNAPPHTANYRTLQDLRYELLPHPPYSPDMAPVTIFLFPQLKERRVGRRFVEQSALGSTLFQCAISVSELSLRTNIFENFSIHVQISRASYATSKSTSQLVRWDLVKLSYK